MDKKEQKPKSDYALLAECIMSKDNILARKTYHKEGKLVLLTYAEVSHLLYAIKESKPEKWLNDQGLVIVGQLQDKLSNLYS